MTFRTKFLLFVSICVPPNNPACGTTSFPGYHSFPKWAIPLALVGYEMIMANSALPASLAIYHLISTTRSCNKSLQPLKDLCAYFMYAWHESYFTSIAERKPRRAILIKENVSLQAADPASHFLL